MFVFRLGNDKGQGIGLGGTNLFVFRHGVDWGQGRGSGRYESISPFSGSPGQRRLIPTVVERTV